MNARWLLLNLLSVKSGLAHYVPICIEIEATAEQLVPGDLSGEMTRQLLIEQNAHRRSKPRGRFREPRWPVLWRL